MALHKPSVNPEVLQVMRERCEVAVQTSEPSEQADKEAEDEPQSQESKEEEAKVGAEVPVLQCQLHSQRHYV